MEEKFITFEWKAIPICSFQSSIDDHQEYMPTCESDLPRHFFRSALVYEIKDKIIEFLFARFAPRHVLLILVSKQFLDFASMKDPKPFNRRIL